MEFNVDMLNFKVIFLEMVLLTMMSFCFRVENSNVYFRGKVGGITDKNIKCLHDFYDSIIVFIGFPKQFIFQTSTLFEMRQRHRP